MPEPIRYPVPWDLVFGLAPYIRRRTVRSVDDFSKRIVERMEPEPLVEGWEHLPANPRFLLVANHYQRKGLWILHPAAVLTQAVRRHYGPGDPPVRWIVTANWPPVRIGSYRFPSPGDWLLPKVAHALACYPVSFVRNNPGFTATSLRQIIRDAPRLDRPIGLFPEGAAGVAGGLTEPLPGVDRLIAHLARLDLPVQPAAISENGRFLIHFGRTISPAEVCRSENAASLVMSRIAELLRFSRKR